MHKLVRVKPRKLKILKDKELYFDKNYQTRGALLSLVSDFFNPFLLKPLIELNRAPLPGSFDVGGACFGAEAEGATGGGGGGGAGATACF